MNTFLDALKSISTQSISILDTSISIHDYVVLNLSKDNIELDGVDITDYNICQNYIGNILKSTDGIVAFGGYLEQRNLYNDKKSFTASSKSIRNIHLGIDFWCDAFTKVIVPYKGKVHSFKFNNVVGDYGPTILLEHGIGEYTFYTLYGHLTLDSLDDLFIGKQFETGDELGRLGTPDINVNYSPHLHFQIIKDLEGYMGDYPGVCAKEQLEFFKENCPDPDILLKLN